MGYGFLFSAPTNGSVAATVNVSVLFAQWFAAFLVAAVGWFIAKEGRDMEMKPMAKSSSSNGKTESEGNSPDKWLPSEKEDNSEQSHHDTPTTPTLPPQEQYDDDNKVFLKEISIWILRIIRGFIGFLFGMQVIGLIPVLTWTSEAVTEKGIVFVMIKVVFLVLFGLIFAGLRKLIHALHIKWYGVPHPSLPKSISL
jgi:hypothetical protein